ncbi:MAG: NAD/NADP octopine/nopaline dehydrogenase family protein [Desulfofustis sp.]|nr:NAD/NADP octopine/nopaline dehydrogenase family protein [Desulfofustis sp.]
MDTATKWAIIGGGNGGQSLAGHLSIMGFSVRLYDIFEKTIAAISEQGGIHVEGAVQGFGKLDLATTDINKAVDGADIVMVVAPATAHRSIAEACAPVLSDGQIVILHPGATCGTLEFRQVLEDNRCSAQVTLAETNTLVYACRSPKPGHANIIGIKKDLLVAAMPARDTAQVAALFREAFPQVVAGKNVLEPSFGNANAVVHPAPSILNTSLIESQHQWSYYYDGITPSIGAFVEKLDMERIDLAKAYGIQLLPILEWYRVAYGVDKPTLTETVRSNPAYNGIAGQKDLKTRYILEDIPTGLVPMIELAKLAGTQTPRMELIARLGCYLVEEDFFAKGRTLKNLGLEHMSKKQFMDYIETGNR